MLQIHLFLNSGSVECIFETCVFIQKLCLLSFHFSKINKRGVGIRVGGLENLSKINKRGGDDYSVLKSANLK